MENCECESELHSLHYYLSNHYKKISMLVFNPYIIKKSTECHKIKGFDPPPPPPLSTQTWETVGLSTAYIKGAVSGN